MNRLVSRAFEYEDRQVYSQAFLHHTWEVAIQQRALRPNSLNDVRFEIFAAVTMKNGDISSRRASVASYS
jgi:hypothetical protein